MKRLLLMIVALGLTPSADARPPKNPPPVLQMRELALITRAQAKMAAVNKRVLFAAPKGWTGDRHPNGRSMTLHGPKGEGKIVIAAALHPEGLTPHLDELKRLHPSAAPSPPQQMTLPGIRANLGERATKFVVTGREVGEMVMIEKRQAIVLMVTVVDPEVWPDVQKLVAKTYSTIDVVNVDSK